MRNNSFVPAILLSSLILSLGALLGIAGTNWPKGTQQEPTLSKQDHTIAFELYENFVFVPVRLKGAEPCMFLLDTGASVSLLNETLAHSLGLEVKHQHESNIGTGEASTRLGFSKDVIFSVSGVDIPAKRVGVVPLADMERYWGGLSMGFWARTFSKAMWSQSIMRQEK